jgi:dienelactone hydrolase
MREYYNVNIQYSSEILNITGDFPHGPGPFPLIVMAPGEGYPSGGAVFEALARHLVSLGLALFRFDWRFSAPRVPNTGQEESAEDINLQSSSRYLDFSTAFEFAMAHPKSSKSQFAIGGKSLGSLVAWQYFMLNREVGCIVLLTPLLRPMEVELPSSIAAIEANYPGILSDTRDIAAFCGDTDPWCPAESLDLIAGKIFTVVVKGDHSFGTKWWLTRRLSIRNVASQVGIFIRGSLRRR